ncbi:MAG: hypothetical protein IJ489_02105 [Clostridia bacterium]|nr:hypothetical protein [Clostridia bacterium]
MKYRFDYSNELQKDILFFNDAKVEQIKDKSVIDKLNLISTLIQSLTNRSNAQLLYNWNSIARVRGDIIEYEKNDLYLIIRYYFNEFQSFLKNDSLLCSVIDDSVLLCDYLNIRNIENYIVIEIFLKLD